MTQTIISMDYIITGIHNLSGISNRYIFLYFERPICRFSNNSDVHLYRSNQYRSATKHIITTRILRYE